MLLRAGEIATCLLRSGGGGSSGRCVDGPSVGPPRFPQLNIEAAIGAAARVATTDFVKARREVFSWRAESFFILVLLMRLVGNLLWTHHFILVNPCYARVPLIARGTKLRTNSWKAALGYSNISAM